MGQDSKTFKGLNALEKLRAGEKLGDNNNRKSKKPRIIKMDKGKK